MQRLEEPERGRFELSVIRLTSLPYFPDNRCACTWAEAGSIRDPVMTSAGHAGVDAMLAGVQARFPGFALKRTSKVDQHNGHLRFAWSLGPAGGPSVVEGVDFCALAPDGRLASVVGFIDKMPSVA